MKIYGYRMNNGNIEVEEAEAIEKTVYVPVEGKLPFHRDRIEAEEIGVKKKWENTIYYDHPALEEVRETYRAELEQEMESRWEGLKDIEEALNNLNLKMEDK